MIIKRYTAPVILMLAAVIMQSCGSVKDQLSHPQLNSENSIPVKTAQHKFSFKLFQELYESKDLKPNPLISPLSVYTDLSMLYNGASNTTQQAMQTALQLAYLSPEVLNNTQAEWLTMLPKIDTVVTFNMANALWYNNNLQPREAFLDQVHSYYDAKIEGADFGDSQTVTAINDWVKLQTEGKIPSIVKNIPQSGVMYLLNAVYFKGAWANPFNSNMTRNDTFYSSEGEVEVPFMSQKEDFNYAKNDSLQILELPYGNGSFKMVVLLPNKDVALTDLVNTMTAEKFTKLRSDMQSTKLRLSLPKWEAAYTVANFKDELSAMGMAEAFSHKADFSQLFKNAGAKISQVKHKTYIKVDERGTEAAAATSIGMVATSMPLHRPVEVTVNRPFLYAIIEENTETILFLGSVTNPLSK